MTAWLPRGSSPVWPKNAVTTALDVVIDPKAYPPLTLYEGRIKF